MSDSVRPHGLQPIRLLHPWDSPGKNTRMGCHFLLHCMRVKSESEVAQSCPTLSDPMDWSLTGSSIHGSFQARVLEWGAIAFFSSTRVQNHQFFSAQPSLWSNSHIRTRLLEEPWFWLYTPLSYNIVVPKRFGLRIPKIVCDLHVSTFTLIETKTDTFELSIYI